MPVHVWGLVRLSLAKRWELLLGLGGGQGKMSGRSCRGLLGQGGREDGGQEAGAAARAGGRQRPRLLLADFQKREKSS